LNPETEKQWHRLMHYVPHYGGFKSEVDGKEFFFAPDGAKNPEAELRASAAAFHTDKIIGRLKLTHQCAFPERFRFFHEVLKLEYKVVECPKFKEFVDQFHNPTGITLIFSSAYPNNPASMFGHTFLKFQSPRKNKLVDTGVNFAAFTPDGANLLAFMYMGVTGGYPGMWSMEPYFQKVNEYINSESRDIWEYDINLSQLETLHLLGHLWELEVNSYFAYYFFDENCSYQILRAIEAIKLDWNLSKFPIFVIPGETIKKLTDIPGAVTDVRYRPSLYHQLENRYRSLSPKDREDFWHLRRSEPTEGTPSPESFDGALLSFMYTRAKGKGRLSEKDQAGENRALDLRRQISDTAKPVEPTRLQLSSRPDKGHDASSIHVSGVWLKGMDSNHAELGGRIKARSSYHDLMAHDVGYSPFSEIEFPWITGQWYRNSFRLEELGAFSTTSLFPLSDFDRRISWRLHLDMARERGAECQNCLIPGLENGAGVTLGGESTRFYALALLRWEAHHDLHNGYRFRPVAELGTIWRVSDAYKTRLVSRTLWNIRPGPQQRSFEFSWDHSLAISQNQELRQTSLLNYTNSLANRSWSEFRLEWVQYFR
jgi:hypothetical protein